MISLLIVIGFGIIAFGLLAIGLLFSKYKPHEEDSDRCFACPIRMLIKYPCNKDHRKDERVDPVRETGTH